MKGEREEKIGIRKRKYKNWVKGEEKRGCS